MKLLMLLPAFLLSLMMQVPLTAQPWRDTLTNYFSHVRSVGTGALPDIPLSEVDEHSLMAFLEPLSKDSSRTVKMKACDLIYRCARKSRNPETRIAGVDLLAKASVRPDPVITGMTTTYLTAFSFVDFSTAARDDLLAGITSRHHHLEAFIRLAGYLQLEEAIPMLREFCTAGQPQGIRWSALVSLARLGDARAAKEMMTRIKRLPVNDEVVYNVFPDLAWSRTREGISYLVEILYRDTHDCLSPNPDNNVRIPCGYRVMDYLAPVVRHFPLTLNATGELDTDDYPAALEIARQWFLQHTGYEIMTHTY